MKRELVLISIIPFLCICRIVIRDLAISRVTSQ